MAELTIKERILKALLESPKTTGNLAIELGYVDEKGYGKYNFIKADLNTLEEDYRFIHRIEQQKKNPGKPPTTYDIVYKISVIKKIWDKYPELKTDLLKSNLVIGVIRDSVLGKKINDLDLFLDRDDKHFYFELIPLWFKQSPSFFEYCLNNDRETIMNRWKEYFILESTHGLNVGFDRCLMFDADGKITYERDEGVDKAAFERSFYDTLEKIYEHYVSNDVLNGYSNPEAVKDIREKRKERIEVSRYAAELRTKEHDRELLTRISWQTFDETCMPIERKVSNKPRLNFGQMEEDGKISLMSNDEKIEYFKKMGVPITEKLEKKYNILVN
ncbi:MAG: hypothetical protein OIN85_10625 [Candidatus Methanoperedens sp.]|nr:hypothetical protein [Candidatus Methanoperedens sp.]